MSMRDGPFYQFWVYIMASPSGTLYIGVTGFLGKRVEQHKLGLVEGFAKKYGCTRLVTAKATMRLPAPLEGKSNSRAGVAPRRSRGSKR